jgi:hypothetical protein
MAVHNLKTYPQFFHALADRTKTCEVRYNDRDYQVGDVLYLSAEIPDGNGGRLVSPTLPFQITHVLPLGDVPNLASKVCPEISDSEFGHDTDIGFMKQCLNAWVVLSLKKVEKREALEIGEFD